VRSCLPLNFANSSAFPIRLCKMNEDSRHGSICYSVEGQLEDVYTEVLILINVLLLMNILTYALIVTGLKTKQLSLAMTLQDNTSCFLCGRILRASLFDVGSRGS
jgi:hypothetical protein